MNYALLFKIVNASVIPAWFLLMVFPRKQITEWVVHSYLYPIFLGILYILLFALSFGGEGGMDTLENLQISFSRDEVLVLGWVHYLVFDLFIGAWIVRDSVQNNISHIRIVPALILTLFLGPIGLLIYLTIRWLHTKKLLF